MLSESFCDGNVLIRLYEDGSSC